MKKIITAGIKVKIDSYIKNGLDISELISEYSIKGLDLTGAIIKYLNVSDEDISNTSFNRATIGCWEGIVRMERARAHHCNFMRTQFIGKAIANHIDARWSNFKGAFLANFEYKYANLQHCNFCNSVFTIGADVSKGAIFSDDFFKDLSEFWGVKIITKSMENNNG